MMDLTPLDVRKKKGDFRRGIRGYEQAQVDDFLELVADRMETLVRSASSVNERIARLEQQVADYRDREKALTEALVTAQQMREDMRTQSTREVEILRKQAEQDADRIRAEAEHARDREEQALDGLRSRQFQFMASYRKYLEQELSELTAMVQGLELHTGQPRSGRAARPQSGPGSAAQPPTPSMPSPAALAATAPPAEAGPYQSTGPAVDVPVGPVDSTPPHSTSVPASPGAAGPGKSQAVEPPTGTPAWQPPSIAPLVGREATPAADTQQDDSTDAVIADQGSLAEQADAPLEEALARWEPELGPDPDESADAMAPGEDSSDESSAGIEAADDLVLSTDDVVAGEAAEASAPDAGGSEDDVDLAFLEFGEDDMAPVEDAAVTAAKAERVEREVSAAMVDADNDYIDIGTALGDEPDDIELEVMAPADEPDDIEIEAVTPADEPDDIEIEAVMPADGPDDIEIDEMHSGGQPANQAIDEADAAIDAAFDFGEFDEEEATGTTMSGPPSSAPVAATEPTPAANRDADIEFVDALLMDTESLFEEDPSEPEPAVPVAIEASTEPGHEATRENGSAGPSGEEFDDAGAEDGAAASHSDGDDADSDLIDLDAFRGFSSYEPPSPTAGDVSSLTLHPMFFEQDPADDDEHEESRQDRWSSSGGG